MMNGKENLRSTLMMAFYATLVLIWLFPFQSTLCQDGWYKILSGLENYLVENIKLQLFLKLVQGRWRRREGWAENYSRLAHPALSWASVSDQFNLQHPSSPPPLCSLLKPIPSPPHLLPHHNLICNILPPLLPKLPSHLTPHHEEPLVVGGKMRVPYIFKPKCRYLGTIWHYSALF